MLPDGGPRGGPCPEGAITKHCPNLLRQLQTYRSWKSRFLLLTSSIRHPRMPSCTFQTLGNGLSRGNISPSLVPVKSFVTCKKRVDTANGSHCHLSSLLPARQRPDSRLTHTNCKGYELRSKEFTYTKIMLHIRPPG